MNYKPIFTFDTFYVLRHKKCDNNNDCDDESDEKITSCVYVSTRGTYNKKLAPRDPTDITKPVVVYFSLMISQIREINTQKLKFTIDFFLT